MSKEQVQYDADRPPYVPYAFERDNETDSPCSDELSACDWCDTYACSPDRHIHIKNARGRVHGFCSEGCAMRWIAKHHREGPKQ